MKHFFNKVTKMLEIKTSLSTRKQKKGELEINYFVYNALQDS